jgi:cytochrome c oxidase cbb3-type subunit 2
MNHGPLIFLGAFFTLACSWYGMVLMPHLQFGRDGQRETPGSSQVYPNPRPGLASQGREVYRANGCQYCHTQRVQPASLASDQARGWGRRHSVAQDYIHDAPVLLGTRRVGPDLANLALRRPADDAHTNLTWHLRHLYNPQITSPGSTMPPYPFLFLKRRLAPNQPRSADALELPAALAPETGYEIVPKPEALALAGYLLSLQADAPLFEAPPPVTAAPAGTNAPAPAAATTNTPQQSK